MTSFLENCRFIAFMCSIVYNLNDNNYHLNKGDDF